MKSSYLSAIVCLLVSGASGYVGSSSCRIFHSRTGQPQSFQTQQRRQQQHYMLPPLLESSSSFWTAAIETFDGSQIIDPVVVSNVFWAGLQGKILSFVLGQFLAAAAFSVLASLAASQIARVGDFVTENVLNKMGSKTSREKEFKIPLRSEYIAQPDFSKLLICLAIDVIGTSSELLPIVGELTDIVWAPIAALLLRSLYGSNILFVLEFTEEILPFVDILPLATLCWVVDTYFGESDLAKLLQLGRYGSLVNGSDKADAIDVDVQASTQRTLKSSSSSEVDKK